MPGPEGLMIMTPAHAEAGPRPMPGPKGPLIMTPAHAGADRAIRRTPAQARAGGL